MELLVATLVYIVPGKDSDSLAPIRFVLDTLRYAQGLVSLRSYRGKGEYLTLTTWEDEECWQQAQERHNPKRLFQAAASDLLLAPPKQWLMQYLWGYSRPAAQPTLAAAHLASIHAEQAEYVQRGWIESLRRQVAQPTPALAFACLARGVDEDTLLTHPPASSDKGTEDTPHDAIFLNLLCWPDEANREKFYADPDYQAISRFLSSAGVMQLLLLEPL